MSQDAGGPPRPARVAVVGSLNVDLVFAAPRRPGAGETLRGTAFDVYSGQGVPAGSRSLALRLRFRAADRTLTDAEVDPVVKHILQRLESAHGIQQRA